MKQHIGLCTVFGFLLAALLLFVCGAVEGVWLSSFTSDIVGLLLVGLVVLVVALILFVANIALTIIHIKNKATYLPFLLLWGPFVFALLGVGVFVEIKQTKQDIFNKNHPDINETHINLSGKYAWALDSDMDMPMPQTDFAWVTRFSNQGLDKMYAYDGWRIAPSFTQANVHMKEGAVNNTNVDTPLVKLPVVPPSRYPDVASLIPAIKANGYGFTPSEASLIEYQYFYYADRLEVVPAIALSGSDQMALWGSGLPITGVHVENAYAKPIARIEIDGDALRIGQTPLTPPDASCSQRNYTDFVLNRFDKPVKVRWQFLEANPAWHEAIVNVPAWTSKSPQGWKIRGEVVFLYLQADGSIASQRQLEMMVRDKHGQDTIGIRTTPIQPALKAVSHCGTADDRWTETVERFPN